MSAATSCKYEQGPCTYPTLRRHFKCQDGSCPEQSGRLCSHGAETKAHYCPECGWESGPCRTLAETRRKPAHECHKGPGAQLELEGKVKVPSLW